MMISREGREYQRSFCTKLRALIRDHKVKAYELAGLLGVKNSTIYNWTSQKTDEEKSRQFPGISVVHKFMPAIDAMLTRYQQQAIQAEPVEATHIEEGNNEPTIDTTMDGYPVNLEDDTRFRGGMLEVAFHDRKIVTAPRMAYSLNRGVVTGAKTLNKENTVGDLLEVLGLKLINVENKIREQEAILEALRGEHATIANTIATIRAI